VAERRCGGAAGSKVPQQIPPEKQFEELAVIGVADEVELGSGPALKVGQAAVARRQRTVADQQAAQVFDRAVRPGGVQGGVAAWEAAAGPPDLPDRSALPPRPTLDFSHPLLALAIVAPLSAAILCRQRFSYGAGERIGSLGGHFSAGQAVILKPGGAKPGEPAGRAAR
jgi:hypothetical protein